MNKLSLFSGIGGDDLASEWAGIETVCFVEKDKFCQKVLKKHWPNIPIIKDVKDVNSEILMAYTDNWRQSRDMGETVSKGKDESFPYPELSSGSEAGNEILGIDIISGGFPCQPHSVAGKHKASADERDLWPEFRRIIGEIKPRWVVAENVPGLFSSDNGNFFGGILSDLASLGYSCAWFTFGAVDVGAWHRRDRFFIVAYSEQFGNRRWGNGNEGRGIGTLQTERPGIGGAEILANAAKQGLERAVAAGTICTERLPAKRSNVSDAQNSDWWGADRTENGRRWHSEIRGQSFTDGRLQYWAVEPDVGRVAHGIPRRVDRLRSLGNAVVPQQIYPIYKAIVEIEQELV